MLIAQALAEYGVVTTLTEAVRNGRWYVDESAREWGVAGFAAVVAAAVIWTLITRVRSL